MQDSDLSLSDKQVICPQMQVICRLQVICLQLQAICLSNCKWFVSYLQAICLH